MKAYKIPYRFSRQAYGRDIRWQASLKNDWNEFYWGDDFCDTKAAVQ